LESSRLKSDNKIRIKHIIFVHISFLVFVEELQMISAFWLRRKRSKGRYKKSVSKLKVSDKLMEIKRNTIRFHKLKRIPSFKKRKRKKRQ